MELEIANIIELNQWLKDHSGHSLEAIKGNAPEGATYSDGDPILKPVNIGWQDQVTGEVFYIEYKTISGIING